MVDESRQEPGEPVVVTIFETYGAGADAIGPLVADSLGTPFHAQAFTSEELERAEAEPEAAEPALGRVLSALGGPAFALGYGTNPGQDIPMAQRDTYELVQDNTRIVLEQARKGGVMVGRNATYVLNDRPRTLHVKLDAPVRERIRRAASTGGLDIEQVTKRQRRDDGLRVEMSVHFYGWDPRELDRYDLVVNTGRTDAETCAAMIAGAARLKAAAT